MDEHEALVTQIGLLLTQTRFARRALEDIERATASYAGFAFTSVIAAGARFGEPPLFDGALKVHVVNISDLAPGSGFGALIEGLLGGAGRFAGNLIGGIFGGAIGSPILAWHLPAIDSLAGRIENILRLIGIGTGAGEAAGGTERGSPVGGSNLITQLESIKRAVNALTGLFLAAGGEPERAAAVSELPSTPEGDRWMRLLDSASTVLSGISRVVDGLIIALPIAVGSIASLIVRLGDVRVAVAETLQFLLRNALMLRGALTVTLFDTLALIARVAANVAEVMGTAVWSMLSVVFDTVQEALLAVLQLGAVVGDAVKATIDALLDWLVPTIDTVLRNFGNQRAFRVLTHVIRILPAIIPPIFELMKDQPFSDTGALREAAELPFLDVVPEPAGGTGATTATRPPRAPDIAALLSDPARVAALTGALGRIEQVTEDGIRIVGEAAQTNLEELARRLDQAAVEETRLSNATLERHLGEVRQQSVTLAEALIVPERLEPRTGLEAIAGAYERWLSEGNGLSTLLGTITRHFTGEGGRAGVPQRIVEGSMDRPRATIQIDEVVIELEETGAEPREGIESAPEPLGPGDFPLPPESDDIERYARMWFEYRLRGGRSDLLPALT